MDVYTVVIVTILATTSILFFLLWRVDNKRSEKKSTIAEIKNIINQASLGGYYYGDKNYNNEIFSVNLINIFNSKKEIKSFKQLIAFFGEEKGRLTELVSNLLDYKKSNFSIDLPLKNNSEERIIHCVGNRVESEFNKAVGVVIWFYDVTEYAHEIKKLNDDNTRLMAEAKDYFNIFNTIPVPIWWRDNRLNIKRCNLSYSKVANDSLTDTTMLHEIPELDENLSGLSKIAINNNRPLHMKKHMIVAGERRYFEITEQEAGNAEGVLGYAVDITKQEEIEKELTRHISAHADLLESSSSAIAIYSANIHLKFFNNAFVKLWGLEEKWLNSNPTYGEILEKLREKRMLPEQADFAKFRTQQMNLFKDLIDTKDEFFYLPNGKALRVIVIPHALGGLLFAYEDMTDRFAMESSYNTLIEVQKETLDNLSEGIAVFGRDGTLKLYNPAYAKMWPDEEPLLNPNVKNFELIELSKHLFNYGDDWDTFKEKVMQRPTTKKPIINRFERTDGKVIDKTVVSLPDGNYLLSYQDVTSAIQAQRSLSERNAVLEEVDKLKTEFLASVSYELRTPLTSIMGFSEMLEAGYLGKLNNRQQEYLSGIIDSSSELMTLINDILDLASMEAGYMRLEIKEFDIYTMIHALAKLVSLRCNAAGISLSLDCSDTIGVLLGDEKRLKQVLFNLVGNSIKFTQKGGKITIHVAQGKKDEVIFTVEDNGVGIEEENKNKVFDRFFKSNSAVKSKKSGTGLGLSVVKSIIDLHAGKIAIESEKGRGTKVIFTLKRHNKTLLKYEN
jgi:signal transduction histidine kinase/PAS domain-containing protein